VEKECSLRERKERGVGMNAVIDGSINISDMKLMFIVVDCGR
jgi:hypothetical protein